MSENHPNSDPGPDPDPDYRPDPTVHTTMELIMYFQNVQKHTPRTYTLTLWDKMFIFFSILIHLSKYKFILMG